MKRRGARAAAVGLAVLALAACTAKPAPPRPVARTAQPAAPVAPGSTATGTVQFMQVVAHEDDDVFFLNPDLYQSIRAGAASVTVYTTGNQLSGIGSTPQDMARSTQRGIENFYARMADVPDADPHGQEEWLEQAWTVGNRQVERFTLKGRPNVQLVFLNMHDGKLDDVYDNGFADSTVVPTSSPVTQSYRSTKADVTAVLLAIVNAYRPSVVRYQDTLPDSRYTGDHGDHYATARLVNDALAGYAGPVTEISYHDYNINDVPRNLSDAAVKDKSHFYADVYAPYDPQSRPFDWLTRQYYRWPRGTQWVARTGAGRPQAFVVRNGVVGAYWLTADGSWAGAQTLGDAGGRVTPGVAAVTNTDGTLQVFARRFSDQHVITIRQKAPDGDWPASWTDLGNPNLTLGGDPQQVGVPAVVANANGGLVVLVKDGSGGLCGLAQASAGGSWGAWSDLGGGTDIQEGVAAIRGTDGRIDIFAATTTGIMTWHQTEPNGSIVASAPLPGIAGTLPASPPAVAIRHDGSLEVLYREAGTTNLITTYQNGAGGAWNPTPVRLGGQGGTGQPALVTAPPGNDARILVFERNDATGVSMTSQQAPDSTYGAWTDLGGTVVEYPAATIDNTGVVYVFAIGYDGALYVRKQFGPGAGSPFNSWQDIS